MTLGIRRRKHIVTAFVLAGILSATMTYSSVSKASKLLGRRMDGPKKKIVKLPARVYHLVCCDPMPYSIDIRSEYFIVPNCTETDESLGNIVTILKKSAGEMRFYYPYHQLYDALIYKAHLYVVDVYGNPIYIVDYDGGVYDGYKCTRLSEEEMRELCSVLFDCYRKSYSSTRIKNIDTDWHKYYK